jgi:hypothetical protein
MRNAIHHFPARPLMPEECALVAEWLASAGDIAATYVSSRRGDDPAHYRRLSLLPNLMRGPHISSMHPLVATFGSCSPLVGEQVFSVSQPFELRSIPFSQCWRTAPRYKRPRFPASHRLSSPIPPRRG